MSTHAQAADAAAADPARSAAAGPMFRERLLPGPGVWAVAIVTGAAFGLILYPISPAASLAASIAMVALVCLALWRTSPVVQVEDDLVALGRATIEPGLLGEPEILDSDGMHRVMGPEIEPLAYRCTRGWIRTGVRLPVLDAEDPAPAWVASSRRPEALARAVRAAQAA